MLDLREIKKMKENSGNEYNYSEPNKKKGRKLKSFLKISVYLAIFFIIGIFIFLNNFFVIFGEKGEMGSFWDRVPVIGQIKHLAESSDKKLDGEDDDRINVLLLGMGGENHEGGYLADTIMLASIKPSTKEVYVLSIPRDLTVPVEGKGWLKINSINAYAEFENEGSGGRATSQTISNLLNIPIHYYASVDFQGFINIIDKLGGVRVYVDQTLDDYSYPVMGNEKAEDYNSRFEHLHVEEGWQEMDGSLALKYARSRHAAGGQGSDFSRAKRQQDILEAAKRKFESTNLLLKPTVIANTMNELKNHFSTNLEIWEIIKFWSIGKDINKDQVKSKVLNDGPNGLLKSSFSTSTGYILLPRSGDFGEIQYLVKNFFQENEQDNNQEEENLEMVDATLEIRNGTWVNGLAGKKSVDLEKYGFEIIRIGNSEKKDFQKSVIYDLTFGEKMDALKTLKEKTNANVSFNIPDWLKENIKEDLEGEENPEQPDFLLILGQDTPR